MISHIKSTPITLFWIGSDSKNGVLCSSLTGSYAHGYLQIATRQCHRQSNRWQTLPRCCANGLAHVPSQVCSAGRSLPNTVADNLLPLLHFLEGSSPQPIVSQSIRSPDTRVNIPPPDWTTNPRRRQESLSSIAKFPYAGSPHMQSDLKFASFQA